MVKRVLRLVTAAFGADDVVDKWCMINLVEYDVQRGVTMV